MFIIPILDSWRAKCKYITDVNSCCALYKDRSDVYEVYKNAGFFAYGYKEFPIFCADTINIHHSDKRVMPLIGLPNNIPMYITEDIILVVSNFNQDVLFWVEGILLECRALDEIVFPVIVFEDGVFYPAIYNMKYIIPVMDDSCYNNIKCYRESRDKVLRRLL